MSVIITGCNGFTGSHLCRLLSEKFAITGVARAGRDVKELVKMGIRCITYNHFSEVMEAGGTLIHCAGKTGRGGDLEEYVRINSEWSQNLAEEAAEERIGAFIYISSIAALGYKNRCGEKVLTESTAPDLCSGEKYGRSKLEAEKGLEKTLNGTDTRLIVLRPGLIYTQERLRKNQTWFRRGFYVDPAERIPLVHMYSFANALNHLLRHDSVSGTFNVVDDVQPTRQELIEYERRKDLLKYKPICIGPLGELGRIVAKMVCDWVLTGETNISLDSVRARFRFQLRKNGYSTDLLQRAVGWTPRECI